MQDEYTRITLKPIASRKVYTHYGLYAPLVHRGHTSSSTQLDTISWVIQEAVLLHITHDALIDLGCYDSVRWRQLPVQRGQRSHSVSEAESEKSEARMRSLRWMEMMWEGTNTTAQEENRKEEVLAVFRELAKDSRRGREVGEYAP